MASSTARVSGLGRKGQFVCQSCLVSLRAARNPARPQWPPAAATVTAAVPPTVSMATTTTIPIRTISQASIRARARRSNPAPRRGGRRAKQLALKAQDNEEDKGFSVKFFNQEADGSLRRINDDGTDDDPKVKAANRKIAAQLDALEGQLTEAIKLVDQIGKGGGNGRTRVDNLRKRYNLLKEIEQEEKEHAGATRDFPKVGSFGLGLNDRNHIARLNRLLQTAFRRLQPFRGKDNSIDAKIISALWTRYGLSRAALAMNWANIPTDVWSCIWSILSYKDPEGRVRNENRMAQIYYLTKDMQAAGVELTSEQQLLAIESMYVKGYHVAALDNWKRAAATLGSNPEVANKYWEMGVRMCALHGDLERAERAADRLFGGEFKENEPNGNQTLGDTDARVLFVLIRSAAARDVKDKAWTAYRRLKAILDQDPNGMQIEDYDDVVSSFLSANQTEYAFAVFVDMMFSGAVKVRGKGGKGKDGEKEQSRHLPPVVANLFFFGKWLKRLIGAGDLDGAYRVLVFMQQHGVMTAAIQVNGLLGAWIRSETAKNQEKADELAWRMIESRRLFVDLRRRSMAVDWPLKLFAGRPKDETENETGEQKFTFVPRASLETFSLMAQNYKERGQVARLEELWVAFKDCEMSTVTSDAFMMNQLLGSYAQEGRQDDARELYQRMVHGPHQIVPNAHTFLSLFRTLGVHRHLVQTMTEERRRADAQACRELFTDMAALAWVFQPAPLGADDKYRGNSAGGDAPDVVQALGRLVAHTFRKTGDYVGLAVALQVLRPILGEEKFAVTDSLAVELVAESSNSREVRGTMVMTEYDTGRNSAFSRRNSASLRRRIFRASEVIEALLLERRQLLEQQAHPPDLSADLAAVVAEFYRHKSGLPIDEFNAQYAAAVEEMGLGDMI